MQECEGMITVVPDLALKRYFLRRLYKPNKCARLYRRYDRLQFQNQLATRAVEERGDIACANGETDQGSLRRREGRKNGWGFEADSSSERH